MTTPEAIARIRHLRQYSVGLDREDKDALAIAEAVLERMESRLGDLKLEPVKYPEKIAGQFTKGKG